MQTLFQTSGPFVLTLDATERAVIIDNLSPGLTYEFNVSNMCYSVLPIEIPVFIRWRQRHRLALVKAEQLPLIFHQLKKVHAFTNLIPLANTGNYDITCIHVGTQGKQLPPEEDTHYVIIICVLGFLVILLVVAFTAWRIRRNKLKKKRCVLECEHKTC